MLRKISFVFLFIFILTGYAKAQKELIDSLRKEVIRPGISVEQRVKDLADLGYLLRYQDMDEALRMGEEAIRLSHSLQDKQYASYAWSKIYTVYNKADSITLVLTAIDSAQWYADLSNDKQVKARALSVAGHYDWARGNNTGAVEKQLAALDLLKSTDNPELISNIDYRLTGTFSAVDDMGSTEKYARQALQEAELSGDYSAHCYAGLCMGTFFEDRYLKYNNPTDLDSALYYTRHVIEIFEKYNGLITARFAGGTAALNYAAYLWRHCPEEPQDTVFRYIEKSIAWSKEIADWPIVSHCYGLMSEYLSEAGKYDEAEKSLLFALHTLQMRDEHNNSAICNIVSGLIRMAERQGDPDKANKYYQMYIPYYKKMYDEKRMSELKVLEATFNYQKKEQEIINLKEQVSYNKKINFFSIGLAILSMLVLVFIFIAYNFKLKSAIQQKRLSEAQAKDAEMQKRLQEEERLRLELEQKVIQQQNELLQKEVFAGMVQLKQKNEVLETVRKEIAGTQPTSRIDQIIKDNLQVDDSFEEYRLLIKETHPNFFKYLQERAQGRLTDLDLKYCTFIYLNFPSKQMANMLHVEYNTIRMNKHRLKQKLHLEKSEDLDHFIKNIA